MPLPSCASHFVGRVNINTIMLKRRSRPRDGAAANKCRLRFSRSLNRFQRRPERNNVSSGHWWKRDRARSIDNWRRNSIVCDSFKQAISGRTTVTRGLSEYTNRNGRTNCTFTPNVHMVYSQSGCTICTDSLSVQIVLFRCTDLTDELSVQILQFGCINRKKNLDVQIVHIL